MKIGTTSFGFRYLLMDKARAPKLEVILEQAAAAGLDVLQICENARPLELPEYEWAQLAGRAARLGLEIQLGAKTLDPAVVEQYLRRSACLPARRLRVVLEEEGAGRPPGAKEVDRLLAALWPLLETCGMSLAIENHFDIPSAVLAEAVKPYPAERVGFCLDTANSLRNFEPPERVMELLGDRAFCYHLKDFRVDGHLLGFTVGGAPLGQGRLDVDWFLDAVFASNSAPEIYIENWVPPTRDWERDVAEDARWLQESLAALRTRLEARGARQKR